MSKQNKPIYLPTLRMKMGELEGLRALRPDVAACVLPILVIPPVHDRESEGQEALFPIGEAVPDVGGIVSKYWTRRPVLIDVRALFKEHGFEKVGEWLPQIFHRTQSREVIAAPLVTLSDLESIDAVILENALSKKQSLHLGLRIQSGEMTDPQLRQRVSSALAKIGITAQKCAVFADFSDADLSDHMLVAPIIRGALEQLQEFGDWQLITFQGTNYPEKNPAEPGETVSHLRSEWLAWREAVHFDPTTADHMAFGDFAADSAKFEFKNQRAKPIPHCRYASGSKWLIVRGRAEGSTHDSMRDVFRRIVNSGDFSGRAFSEADAYIEDAAMGVTDGSGNASTWRQLNTTHHITQVVADIAKVRGIPITELPSAPNGIQLALLGE